VRKLREAGPKLDRDLRPNGVEVVAAASPAAPGPAARQSPQPGIRPGGPLPPTQALFVAFALAVLAETYLEEHQEHGAAQARGHEDEREDLARQPADERGADAAGDDERGGRSEREDA
jgi:hypothetical protein